MKDEDRRSIEFTIDGRQFKIEEPDQTAGSLLVLAGLEPAQYDLAELRGAQNQPHRLEDGQKVRVKDGDRFVSVRQMATVA